MTTNLSQNINILKSFANKTLFKAAEGTESNYEQALYNISKAYINDVAPSLAKYEIGFQLVEKSDDNTRAVGVFGFKINNKLIYIPVFYIDGKVYGYDMMFLYNTRQFMPVLDDYIRNIMSQDVPKFGDTIDAVSMSNQLAAPNLMQLKPSTLKWAMDQPSWFRPFIADYISFKLRPSINWNSDIRNFVKSSSTARLALSDFLSSQPRWISVFQKLYGEDFHPVKLKKAAVDKPRKVYMADLRSSREPADVELYVYISDSSPNKLSPTELDKLRRQGYLVRDNRKQTALIRKAPNKSFSIVTQPKHGGFHHLLLNDLSVMCAYVVPVDHPLVEEHNPKAGIPIERKNQVFLVVPIYVADEKGNILIRFAGRHGLLVEDRQMVNVEYPGDKTEHDFNKFQDAKELNPKEKERYCFFTREKATPPLYFPKSSQKAHRGRIVFSGAHPHLSNECHSIVLDPNERKLRPQYPVNYLDRKSNPKFPDAISQYCHYAAPLNGTKVVQLIGGSNQSENEKEIATYVNKLMRLEDVTREMLKSADYVLEVAQKDGEFLIDNKPYNFIKAFDKLLKHYNLSEQDALMVIKEASSTPTSWLIKNAQNMLYPGMPTPPSAPNLRPDQLTGQLGSYNMQVPSIQAETVDMPQKTPAEIEKLNQPWFNNLLNQAIQSGQKEVLDMSVLGGLLNIESDEDVIENNLPKAMEGLSALGAMRFGIYAHWDLFKERFGEEDLEKLENSLKTVFKEVGRVLVKLQQRPEGFTAKLNNMIHVS